MAMPFDAVAQSEGIYLSGALGAVWPQDAEFVGTGISAEASFHPGLFGSLALGTTFGNIWRSDVELSYRASDVGELSGVGNGSGEVNGSAAMINGYYDLFSGSDLRPYLGGGIGIMRLIADGVSPIGGSTIDDEDTVVAVQGVAGVGYRVNDWLGLFTDYRFLATTETEFTTVAGRPLNWEYREHRIVVGLRWSFGGAEFDRQTTAPRFMEPKKAAKKLLDMPWSPDDRPKAAPTTKQPIVPLARPMAKQSKQAVNSPEPVKSSGVGKRFFVYFDWDRWVLTPEALLIIQAAGEAGAAGRATGIHATGHADRSGPVWYNMVLSQRRAEVVKAELVKLGVPADAVTVEWKGETTPVIKTADGIREAMNRRVEVLLR